MVLKRNNINSNYVLGGIIFGIISLPLSMYYGTAIRIPIMLLAFILVVQKRVEFFPGLIIHLFLEQIPMLGVLFGTLAATLSMHKYWMKSRLKWIYILTLIPLPIFVYQSFYKYFELNFQIIEILTFWPYYLGLFPFFYGIAIAPKLNKTIYSALIFVISFALLFMLTPLVGKTVRIVFFTIPFLFAFFANGFTAFQKSNRALIVTIFILAILYFYINLNQLTLTLLLSCLLAFVLVYLKRKDSYFLKPLSSKWIILFGLALLVVGITRHQQFIGDNVAIYYIDYDDWQISDFDQIRSRLTYKFFADRVPIWAGTWNYIWQQKELFPSMISEISFEIKYLSGHHGITSIGAHNLILELLKYYGWIAGLITGTVYYYYLYFAGRALRVLKHDTYQTSLFSTAFSVGLVGSIVGSFPLIAGFSFLIISLFGIAYYKLNTFDLVKTNFSIER